MHDVMGRKVETAVEARAGFLDSPVLVVSVACSGNRTFRSSLRIFGGS
jgi:hypothetical protein